MITKKFYKAKNPAETIHNIREILFKTGLFVNEYSGATQAGFYNSHLYLASNRLAGLKFGVHGKGSSPEYALASAYGEFMERFQNNWKLWGERYITKNFIEALPPDSEFVQKAKEEDVLLNFELFPDEKYIPLRDLISQNDGIFKKLIKNSLPYLENSYNLDRTILCVPYYNLFKENITYLPPKTGILGTNGLCAGNTDEEAIIQGLCEIFERYVIRKVYLEGIIPPIIPKEEFHGTSISEKIDTLNKEKNIETIVFDCSLNIGLPVVGILFIDKDKGMYTFSFGGATDPVIALERCLTEIYQSDTPEDRMNYLNKKVEYPGRNAEQIKIINYIHQVTHGGGEIDIEAFLSQEASYSFNNISMIEGENHKEELKNIVALIQNQNWELLIRDNSILGFPSYSIYIPNVSEVFSIFNDDDFYMALMDEDLFPILSNLKYSSKEKINEYLEFKDQLYDKVRDSLSNFKGEFMHHVNAGINDIEPFLFMSTLFYYIGKNEKAIKYIDKFIEREKQKNPTADLKYFFAAKYFLRLKINNFSLSEIKDKLSLLYTDEIVDEIMDDMSNPENALHYYDLPTCFNCEDCPVKKDCRYFDVMKIVKSIQNNMRKDINQTNIKKLLQ